MSLTALEAWSLRVVEQAQDFLIYERNNVEARKALMRGLSELRQRLIAEELRG